MQYLNAIFILLTNSQLYSEKNIIELKGLSLGISCSVLFLAGKINLKYLVVVRQIIARRLFGEKKSTTWSLNSWLIHRLAITGSGERSSACDFCDKRQPRSLPINQCLREHCCIWGWFCLMTRKIGPGLLVLLCYLLTGVDKVPGIPYISNIVSGRSEERLFHFLFMA